MYYPYLALFDRPDPELENEERERKQERVAELTGEQDSISGFDRELEQKQSGKRVERSIVSPPSGESYGMHSRDRQLALFDVYA
ncbi:MAG: hypothetical protein MAG453_00879 [Calditrichaeota bacterium]|nr:hypothetical protein [Calditrichota bacterium]